MGTLFQKEAAQQVKQEWLESQKEEAQMDKSKAPAASTAPRDMAVAARTASRALQSLSSKQREQLLHEIAENLLAKEAEIMAANDRDCQVTLLMLKLHHSDSQSLRITCQVRLRLPKQLVWAVRWRSEGASQLNSCSQSLSTAAN